MTFLATAVLSACGIPILVYLDTFVPQFEREQEEGFD
jgi:hypothetical protein